MTTQAPPKPPPFKARVPKPPPRPLDPTAVAEAVAPVPGLVREFVALFAATDYDRWTYAGCRLVASALGAIRRAELCRDLEGVRQEVAFLNDYLGLLPERLHSLRTPGAWVKNNR